MARSLQEKWLLLPLTLIVGGLIVSFAQGNLQSADNPPVAEDQIETEKGKQRLEFMLEAVGKYQIEICSGDPQKSDLNTKPLLRWSNPVSNVVDGLVAAYTRGGRPDALVQFHVHRNGFMVHEFSKTTLSPLVMKRGDRVVWSPNETWIEFKPLPDAPEPAKSAALRLPQIRKQAERFSVVDDFEVEQVPTPNHLRLLAKPLFRYSDVDQGGDIVDGAVFSFVMGTNPEANLFVEVCKKDDQQNWRYAWAPMTIYALQAKLDDAVVWTKPSYKSFCDSTGPYFACQHAKDPADKDIKELLK